MHTALLFGVLLTFSKSAWAEQLPVKTYTIADGLAHDEINRIIQDSHGFLWFCTIDGLSRFDGYRFTNYTAKDGLASSYVTDMLESRSGVYWIATSLGVSRFNPSAAARGAAKGDGRAEAMFTTYRLGKDSLANISSLFEDRQGRIWVGASNGLFLLETGKSGDDVFQRVRMGIASQPDDVIEITTLIEDHEGSIWIGTSEGLVRRTPDGRMIHYPLLPTESTNYVWAILEDRDGRLWAGHQTGLFVFRPVTAAQAGQSNDSAQSPFSPSRDKASTTARAGRVDLPDDGRMAFYTTADGLTHNNVHALYQSIDGRVWIGTYGGGLSVFDGQGLSTYAAAQGLSNRIESLAEDRNGNLWVGSQGSGAMKIARSGFLSYGEADGLGSSEVVQIYEDRAGELVVISAKWTINRLDGERFKAIRPNLPQQIIDSSSGRWVIIQDHLGEWWVATNQGLYRFPNVSRLEDLARVRPLAVYTKPGGLADNYISRLFEDSRGDIWIGSFHPPEMLTRWERSTNTLHRYSEKDGLPSLNWANVFAEDRAGTLWIGLHNGGLARRRNDRFEIFGAAEGVPVGLGQGLYFDRAGRLWIATRAGAGRIDNPNAPELLVTQLSGDANLSSENFRCFVEDEQGYIYIGTARGVDRLDPATGRVKHYSTDDGLISSEVMTAFRDRQGTLWFGTRGGLSRLASEGDPSQATPPVFISAMRVAGVPYPISELGETEVAGLNLAADQNQIEIDFFGLGFATGESLRYQYMIEGVDREWSAPTDQRTVTANLSPGSYRFRVRAINADGLTSDTPATVSFTIMTPVWRRWWFLLLCALFVAAVAYAIYRYRMARAIELERIRTRIATDLHDDMGASLSQIAILSEVAKERVERDNSPVREPLTMIADTSREMVGSMSDIVWAINPERDHLSDLTQRMRRFAGDILNARDMDFRFHAPAQGDRDINLGADIRREVYLIFKECVNNLVKHSGCTEAELEFQVEGGWLTIKVSDNGCGFDPQHVGDGQHGGMGGHGLNSLRQRAASLGGKFHIESERGRGTTVTLRVPVTGRPPFNLKRYLHKYVGRSNHSGM
ncbi:MAG TPA: two-component regulator propeller domain-containing protein [Pyrinomonadaceae bacterium]|nr:two-component regulator propeller domain-containing protein [Pyrinomonadaceae bacterium]